MEKMGRDMENYTKWRKENLKQIVIKLNVTNEKDIIEWLESKPNKRKYLIDLIRNDMKR